MSTRFLSDREHQAAACSVLNAIHLTGNWERFMEEFPEAWAMVCRTDAVVTDEGAIVITVYEEEEMPKEAAVQ